MSALLPLQRLLSPRSIAVLGGAPAERVVRQCRLLGFDGPIWPVHPHRAELAGEPCVPTVADLPGGPDAVFVGVNRHTTVSTMAELAVTGAGGAVCYGSGFAEAGADGAELQRQLVVAAAGLPFFGPNCYGYVNAFDGVALWPDEHGCRRVDRGVAIVSQSGNVGLNLTLQQRGLRMGYVVTVGNQADLGVEDCLDAFLDDERVTAIGLFIESVRDPQRFAVAAQRAAAQGVPVVALQTGRSDVGARIARSHTAALAGHGAAYDALFERYGVASVRTPSELLETLKLLDGDGPLTGGRMVSLSCSGGEASLVADLSEGSGLTFTDFDDAHRIRIEATLTELVSVSNPFDYHTFMWGNRTAMGACFAAVMGGPQDATVLVLDAPPGPDNDATAWLVAVDAFGDAAAATGRRGVVLATLAECLTESVRDRVRSRGLTALQGVGDGLAALGAAAWSAVHPCSPSRHAPVVDAEATRLVDEAAAKERLAAIGIDVPRGEVAPATLAQASVAAAARRIGYPVTLKAMGIAHKSETAAVAVGLADAAALATALATMPQSPAGYLVEATVTDVVAEVLVAVRRDAPVGWLVTVGAGGVLAEVLADAVHLLAPVTVDDVKEAVARLRSFPLLDGFRGRPRADLDALAALIVRLVDAVVGTSVVELELNPVLVGRDGAVAVDALWMEEESG